MLTKEDVFTRKRFALKSTEKGFVYVSYGRGSDGGLGLSNYVKEKAGGKELWRAKIESEADFRRRLREHAGLVLPEV